MAVVSGAPWRRRDVRENSQSGTNWEGKGSRLLKYRNWIFRIGGGGTAVTLQDSLDVNKEALAKVCKCHRL